MNQISFNIGLIKVMHMSGTSSLIVGEGYFNKQTSHSKTNNGVGNAYGDHSDIHMTPYKSIMYDSNTTQYDLPKKLSNDSK